MAEPTTDQDSNKATKTDPPPANATNAPVPKNADPNKPANAPAGPSTPLRIRATYENIPGQSKTGPKEAKEKTALWFDPLTIASTSPDAESVVNRVGVTKGGGQVIATQAVPLHGDGEPGAGEGTGTVTAQLQYASDLSTSFSVKVTGDFKRGQDKAATTELKSFVGQKFLELGDLDRVKELALAHVQDKYPEAKNLAITLTPIESGHVLQDAGKTHVYYKARSKPVLQLDVPVVAVADRQITSGATTTKQQGSGADVQTHQDVKTDTTKVTDTKTQNEGHVEGAVQTEHETYEESNQRTYDQIITTIQSRVDSMTQNLVAKLDKDSTYHDKGNWTTHDESFHFDDYTKNVKGGSEEGDKDKKNWAAWLEDGLGWVSDAISLPIPGGAGKWLRKLNEYGLAIDLAQKAAGVLAVRGKVHYIDTHEDTEAHDKQHDKDDARGDHDRTVTRIDHDTLTKDLKGTYTSLVNKVQITHGTDKSTKNIKRDKVSTQVSGGGSTKTDTDTYDSNRTQTDVGGQQTVRANQSTSTEITWSQSVKETTTKPVLTATVVDGDGEVSSTPFPAPTAKKK